MPFVTAGQLRRHAPTALENDSLGLVAENLRSSPYGTIAVIDQVIPVEGEYGQAARVRKEGHPPRLLGLIDEQDLSRAARPFFQAQNASEQADQSTLESTDEMRSVSALCAREVMRTDFGFIPAMFSLENTLLTLDRYEVSALPVLDEEGRYLGLVSRADVVAALGENIRPPVVGGMATPLGVWLTDGRLTGGAPPIGLFLSGLVLAACYSLAHFIMLLLLAGAGSQWAAQFYSGRVGLGAEGGGLFNLAVTCGQGVIFLLALRLTPMAGIHAAEHQTVWAIERGLPLVPEVVAQMPRAHPRCGTNIMALIGLITIWLQHLPSFDSGMILFSLIFTFFFWRQFGTALQEHFTTRPATRAQLEGGIKAGQEIMKKYQAQEQIPTPFVFRLLNSGMLLSFAGMLLGIFLLTTAEEWLARWILGF